MARPTRRKESSFIWFRKRIPADIQRTAGGQRLTFTFPADVSGDPPIIVQATVGSHVKFSLRTRDPAIAKERAGLAAAQLERLCEAFRNGPRPLTHKQRVALSGLLYRRMVTKRADTPGAPEGWQRAEKISRRVAIDPASRERVLGPHVDQLLAREGIITDAESRTALLTEVGRALAEAFEHLYRNASGDYRPDPNAQRFPEWEGVEAARVPVAATSLTFDGLFERWQREARPAASTITTWRSYVRSLRDHVGHDDVSRVTRVDIVAWKDALVAAGRTAKGIKDGHLTAIRSLYNYALENGLLSHNPVQGVKVRYNRATAVRMLPYTDGEVAQLLALADNETHAGRRWLPWFLALSGARIGEVAQLWGKRVVEVDGVLVMKLSPAEDGGSFKNAGSERVVPIHPAILERGFLAFVKSRGDGPLFYRGSRGKARPKGNSPASRHASKGVANHLATWIRAKGFTDKRKAPSHAFRHWFKTACQKAGVLDSVADAIQGHAGRRGEADGYRHSGVEVMAEAIARLPVPTVVACGTPVTSRAPSPPAGGVAPDQAQALLLDPQVDRALH